MKQPGRFLRFILGLGLVLLVLWIGFIILLTVIPTWGTASPDEMPRVLPGREMAVNSLLFWNHAASAPKDFWPWLWRF